MKGLIFIPDISGFTNFVCKVPPAVGAKITMELLTEILDNSLPDLSLAEVEGDALLFYKLGEPVPLDQMLASFRKMAAAFKKKYRDLRTLYKVNTTLPLKFILHYGDIDIYHVKSFEKLYGQTLVESHRLLKNGCVGSDYLLITEDYIQAGNQVHSYGCIGDRSDAGKFHTQKITQHFSNLRDIQYYFFDSHARKISYRSVATNSEAC